MNICSYNQCSKHKNYINIMKIWVRIKRRTGIRNTVPECGIRNWNAEPDLRIKHGNEDETSNWVF